MRVSFQNFWPGFNPHTFFIPLLEDILSCTLSVVPKRKADLIVYSVFMNQIDKFKQKFFDLSFFYQESNAKTIWFSGENRRPPLDGFNLSLSFDPNSSKVKNIYFPFWFLLFPEMINNSVPVRNEVYNNLYSFKTFMSNRLVKTSSRKKFACILTSHAEYSRIKISQLLSEIGQVDYFGNYSQNYLSDPSKVLSDYRYVICFENDLYPGYVTEKVFNAWFLKTVPVWSGIDKYNFINPKAVINYNDFDNFEGILKKIILLENNPHLIDEITSQPLLLRLPNIEEIKSNLRRFLYN